MRDFSVVTIIGSELQGEWAQFNTEEKKIKTARFCEFSLAEEVIGLLEYDDGTYEVGIGEVLRPYIEVYKGDSAEEADAFFIDSMLTHIK